MHRSHEIEEESKNARGGAAGASGSSQSTDFLGVVGSTFAGVYKKAQETLTSVTEPETQERTKKNLSEAYETTKQTVSSGAGVAYEKSTEVLSSARETATQGFGVGYEKTKEGLSWTAEKTGEGASAVYAVSCDAGSTIKGKLDEVGVTSAA